MDPIYALKLLQFFRGKKMILILLIGVASYFGYKKYEGNMPSGEKIKSVKEKFHSIKNII
jgi:hypothetical protein